MSKIARSLARKRSGECKTGTYTLDLEPGRFDIGGLQADQTLFWLKRTYRLIQTDPSGATDPEELAEIRHQLAEATRRLREGTDHVTGDLALNAIVAALRLGFFHLGSHDARRRLEANAEQKFNSKRVAAANQARRQPDIQAIIEKHAKALWARDPGARHNLRYTAHAICDQVVAEVRCLKIKKVPKGWELPDPLDDALRDRLIETIRRRLSRLPRTG